MAKLEILLVSWKERIIGKQEKVILHQWIFRSVPLAADKEF